MTLSLGVLLLLLAAFLMVCAFEWVGMEVAAVGLVVALALTGLLEPDEAIAGFANPVVIAIAGLFVINAAVERTGVIAWLGGRLAGVALRSPRGGRGLLLAGTGRASAFISNVATVGLLLPAVLAACRRAKVSPSRYLMPLAYVSLVGGMATLIGATGNLIVQGMAVDGGARPFAFFEFAYIGLPMLAIVLVYLVTVGWRLVPDRRPETGAIAGSLRDFLVEVSLPPGSPLIGRSLREARLRERFGLTLLAIRRGGRRIVSPAPREVLETDDRLVVEGGAEDVAAASASGEVVTDHDTSVGREDVESDRINLYEVLVPPRSTLVGRTARGLRLRQRWGLTLLAVLRGGSPIRRRPERVRIRPGDELLIQAPATRMEAIAAEEDLILLNRVPRGRVDVRGLLLPVGTLAGVITLAATGVTSLAIAVLLGVTVLVVGRALNVEQAIHALDLKVIVVVACVLPIAHAVEAAGAIQPLGRAFGAVHVLAGPWTVLATLFVATSLLVQLVQKAAIALAVPLAFAAAQATGADTTPFLMAVAIAGSCAFLTPLAHPVNLLVHAPGHYRFDDFLRIGLPLQLLVTIVAIALIPLIWPFA